MPSLRPFTDDELGRYVSEALVGYIEQRQLGGESYEVAERLATDQHARLFPGGRPAAGQVLFAALDDDGARVGHVWVGPHPQGVDDSRWVYDIEIDTAHRGRGLGRAVLTLAEEYAASTGARTLGLNVFGGNTVARSLYTSAGYEETAVNMRKVL